MKKERNGSKKKGRQDASIRTWNGWKANHKKATRPSFSQLACLHLPSLEGRKWDQWGCEGCVVYGTGMAMSNKTRVKSSSRQREAEDKGGVYNREKKRVQGFLGRLEQEEAKTDKGCV